MYSIFRLIGQPKALYLLTQILDVTYYRRYSDVFPSYLDFDPAVSVTKQSNKKVGKTHESRYNLMSSWLGSWAFHKAIATVPH